MCRSEKDNMNGDYGPQHEAWGAFQCLEAFGDCAIKVRQNLDDALRSLASKQSTTAKRQGTTQTVSLDQKDECAVVFHYLVSESKAPQQLHYHRTNSCRSFSLINMRTIACDHVTEHKRKKQRNERKKQVISFHLKEDKQPICLCIEVGQKQKIKEMKQT